MFLVQSVMIPKKISSHQVLGHYGITDMILKVEFLKEW